MSKPHVEFYTESIESTFESEQAGRPIFKDVDFVRISIPGDINNILETQATPHYQQKFPHEWAAYIGKQTDKIVGTPLSAWARLTKSQVREAEYFQIRSVEQLASISDSVAQRLGSGWMGIRKEAQAFLDAAQASSAVNAQAAENNRLQNEIETLKAQMQALLKSDTSVEADAQEEKPRRGRPPAQKDE